jgi:hypothetical protein
MASKYPELLSHEGKQDEQVEEGNFIAYIAGVDKLPAKFLRLRLGSNTPTVGELVSKAEAVVGKGMTLSFEGKTLPSNLRSYLHRLAPSGSVFMAAVKATSSVEQPDQHRQLEDEAEEFVESTDTQGSPRKKRTRLLLPGARGQDRYWCGSSRQATSPAALFLHCTHNRNN